MADQRRDVGRALAQGRQPKREDVEPIVEITAEVAVSNHLGEIAVRGGHQAHVHLDGPGAAQALELLFLQHTEQLGLQFWRNVADLIKK
jgi:hypothetical protein